MDEIKDKEVVHYQWVLNRIQTFKYLIVTTILALMAYTASSIDITGDLLSLAILSISAIFSTNITIPCWQRCRWSCILQ